MVALEAGCEQKPDPGELISLSGSIFTTSAVNITTPAEDILEKPKGAGSNTLTTGAIVGIAVGVGLFLLGGVALFFIYWRRQKRLAKNEKNLFRSDSFAGTPDPFFPPESNQMTASLRSYSQQSNHGSKGGMMTSGDYYDKLEEEIHVGRLNYNFDPRAASRGPNSALPAHQAYIPRAISRLRNDETIGSVGRNPSPPAATHRYTKSHPTNSVPLQDYVSSSSNSNVAPVPPPPAPPSRRTASVDRGSVLRPPPPPPGPPPPKSHRHTPSLTLPLSQKLRLPKKYSPPKLENEDNGLKISQPVMRTESRFVDRPLQGGPVLAENADGVVIDAAYAEKPIRSGKSDLYGY